MNDKLVIRDELPHKKFKICLKNDKQILKVTCNNINSTFYQGQWIGDNTQRIIYHAKWHYRNNIRDHLDCICNNRDIIG